MYFFAATVENIGPIKNDITKPDASKVKVIEIIFLLSGIKFVRVGYIGLHCALCFSRCQRNKTRKPISVNQIFVTHSARLSVNNNVDARHPTSDNVYRRTGYIISGYRKPLKLH